MMDGTRSVSIGGMSENGIVLGNTDVYGRGSNADCLLLMDEAGTVIVRATCTNITDGVQLNFATAPASALLVTVVLFGGSNISNLYAGVFTSNATQDATQAISAPGFKPSFGIFSCYGDNLIDNTSDGYHSQEIGFAVDDGATPPTQYVQGLGESDNLTTSSVSGSIESNTIGRSQVNTTGAEVELTTWDTNGFTVTTRSAAGAKDCLYLVAKTTLSTKILALDTPTTTGAQSWSGIGFTPQFGMIMQNALTSYNTRSTTDTAEVFGLGFMTSASQHSVGITSDDGIVATGTTNTESVTHTRPIFLRKDEGTFIDATFTSFGSGVVNLNYATANGTIRKWAGLFIGVPTSSFGPLRRRGY
jgi:hypothetical protein